MAFTREEIMERVCDQVRAGRAHSHHRLQRRHRNLGEMRPGRRSRPDHRLQLGSLPHGRPGPKPARASSALTCVAPTGRGLTSRRRDRVVASR